MGSSRTRLAMTVLRARKAVYQPDQKKSPRPTLTGRSVADLRFLSSRELLTFTATNGFVAANRLSGKRYQRYTDCTADPPEFKRKIAVGPPTLRPSCLSSLKASVPATANRAPNVRL